MKGQVVMDHETQERNAKCSPTPRAESSLSEGAFAVTRPAPSVSDCGMPARGAPTPSGRRPKTVPMRSSWSLRRRRGDCPNCFPCATGAWRDRRSPFTGARRSPWPRTSRPRRSRASVSSAAGTHTCATSADSPRRRGGSSSPSTTSTRRSRGHGSGTSSASPQASWWPAGTTA